MSTLHTSGARPAGGRFAPVDRLRAFLTMLVVLHHALVGYHPYAPPVQADWSTSLMWRAFPVVDAARMPGADLLVAFNDTFFMALMFLLAGLYTWPALQARGAGGFLRERALRLGVPFLAACALLAPLAYYPSWLQRGGNGGVSAYLHDWLALPVWPAGPAWFLWVLLTFAGLAAVTHRGAPGLQQRAARLGEALARRPLRAFVLLALLSALNYVPMERVFGAFSWFEFGPFTVQTARLGVYALYFAVGMVLGARGNAPMLQHDGALAARWGRWSGFALLAFFTMMGLVIAVFAAAGKGEATGGLTIAADIAFCVACAAISFALLGLFARRVRGGGAIGSSLDHNAFGIYVVHYVFVAWLQYALLDATLPAVAKASIVFGGALALSWGTAAVLRRIPGVRRVLGWRVASAPTLDVAIASA